MGPRTEDTSRATMLLVLLAGGTFPVVQLVKTVVDRATTVRDVTGAVHFVSDGRAGQLVELGAAISMLALAVHLLVHSVRAGRFQITSWAVLAAVVLAAEVLRGRAGVLALGFSVVTVGVLFAAGTLRLNRRALHAVGLVAGFTALSNIAFSMINPERGLAACRAGKCTVAGGLLRGYFPQENVLGMYLATLLPTVAFVRHPLLRRALLSLILVAVVLTGSRTALAASVLGLWAYAVLRRRSTPGRRHGDAAKVVALVPLTTFLISAVLLFSLPDMALTGRGLIFRIVREAWADRPLLGPGREALYDAYDSSVANWYLAHEHGQAAYVLGSAGLLGVALTLVALLGIVRASWADRSAVPAVFALVPALGFLTEPTWEMTVRSPYLVSLLLTVALTSLALRREPLPVPADDAPELVEPRQSAPDGARATLSRPPSRRS